MDDSQKIPLHKTKLPEDRFRKNHLRVLPNRAGDQQVTDTRGI